MVRSHSFAWILVSLLSLTLAAPLQADITPSGDVDPTLPDNLLWWTGGGDSSTTAIIGKTDVGDVTVNSGSDLSSSAGLIGYWSSSTGEVIVDGGGSTWTNSNGLSVGSYGQGTLNITNSGAVSNTFSCIGMYSGSVGEATVDGSGSTWTNSDYLYVGSAGQGTLNITNGGAVVCSDLVVGNYVQGTLNITNGGAISNSWGHIGDETGSTGVVTVDGIGSTWTNNNSLYVGNKGHGTLNITNGGVVSNTWGSNIGRSNPGSTGVVTVDGSGSTWTCEYLSVGSWGQGTLNITNGGVVSNNSSSFIGSETGSTGVVTVDGSGSTWNSSVCVGNRGQGTLNITNGGVVSNDYDGHIGYRSGSTGVVTVDGSGSTWVCSGGYYYGLYVGRSGQGTLNITNGGAVSNNSNGYIGKDPGSVGVVTVDGIGSTWTNNCDLYVGGGTSSSGGSGELTVSGGGSVEIGETLKIWGPGTLNIGAAGQVTVGGTLVLAQDSTLTADAGATIHMTGSAFQNESTNSANLAGLGNLKMIFEGGTGVVDPFEAAGEDVGAAFGGFVTANFLLDTLQLGGTATGKIQLVDDFDNQADGSGVGEAVYVNTLIMNAGATIDLNRLNLYYLNGGGPKQFFYGDATLDGYIDGGDLDILLADWGTGVPPANPRADLSGDFYVDGNDLDLILSDWGKGVPPPVPEPVSATLLLLGAAAILKRRRK